MKAVICREFAPVDELDIGEFAAPEVAPGSLLSGEPGALSRKFVQNCEQRRFQRPDDAIHRGYDR